MQPLPVPLLEAVAKLDRAAACGDLLARVIGSIGSADAFMAAQAYHADVFRLLRFLWGPSTPMVSRVSEAFARPWRSTYEPDARSVSQKLGDVVAVLRELRDELAAGGGVTLDRTSPTARDLNAAARRLSLMTEDYLVKHHTPLSSLTSAAVNVLGLVAALEKVEEARTSEASKHADSGT